MITCFLFVFEPRESLNLFKPNLIDVFFAFLVTLRLHESSCSCLRLYLLQANYSK